MKVRLGKWSVVVMLLIGMLYNSVIIPKYVTAESSVEVEAKKAYSELLSKSTVSWGSNYSTTKLNFSCIDINSDDVPELIVENEAACYADGYYKIYEYISGRVKCIWTGFSDKPTIYTDNGIIYDTGSHMESWWEHYYVFENSNVSIAATHETYEKFDDDFNYINTSHEYKIEEKTATESEYIDYVDELTEYSDSTSYNLVKNTSSNRNKLLVKSLYSYEELGIDTTKNITFVMEKKMTNNYLYYYKGSFNYKSLEESIKVNQNKVYKLSFSPSCKYYFNGGQGVGEDEEILTLVGSYSEFIKGSSSGSYCIKVKNKRIIQIVELYMP